MLLNVLEIQDLDTKFYPNAIQTYDVNEDKGKVNEIELNFYERMPRGENWSLDQENTSSIKI